jgi:hypothetical protein
VVPVVVRRQAPAPAPTRPTMRSESGSRIARLSPRSRLPDPRRTSSDKRPSSRAPRSRKETANDRCQLRHLLRIPARSLAGAWDLISGPSLETGDRRRSVRCRRIARVLPRDRRSRLGKTCIPSRGAPPTRRTAY